MDVAPPAPVATRVLKEQEADTRPHSAPNSKYSGSSYSDSSLQPREGERQLPTSVWTRHAIPHCNQEISATPPATDGDSLVGRDAEGGGGSQPRLAHHRSQHRGQQHTSDGDPRGRRRRQRGGDDAHQVAPAAAAACRRRRARCRRCRRRLLQYLALQHRLDSEKDAGDGRIEARSHAGATAGGDERGEVVLALPGAQRGAQASGQGSANVDAGAFGAQGGA